MATKRKRNARGGAPARPANVYGPQLYGEHLAPAPGDSGAARRGNRAGPEGGKRQGIPKVPTASLPATPRPKSAAGPVDGYRGGQVKESPRGSPTRPKPNAKAGRTRSFAARHSGGTVGGPGD